MYNPSFGWGVTPPLTTCRHLFLPEPVFWSELRHEILFTIRDPFHDPIIIPEPISQTDYDSGIRWIIRLSFRGLICDPVIILKPDIQYKEYLKVGFSIRKPFNNMILIQYP